MLSVSDGSVTCHTATCVNDEHFICASDTVHCVSKKGATVAHSSFAR